MPPDSQNTNLMRLFYGLLLFTGVLLAGCDQQEWFDKFVPKEEAEFAKRAVGQFAARDFASIERSLVPILVQPDTRSKLQQVAEQVPSAPPLAVQIVGAHTLKTSDRDQYDLTLQYEYPGKWLLANVVLHREKGELRLAGIHVRPLPDSLQNINRFTFAGKSPIHFLVLALAVLIPLFVIATLVSCARTPIARRKWLWLLFIAVGLVRFSLNWTDGTWEFTPISFLLLGAGFNQAGPAAPYVFAVAAPIGAVLFWFRRKSLRAQPAA